MSDEAKPAYMRVPHPEQIGKVLKTMREAMKVTREDTREYLVNKYFDEAISTIGIVAAETRGENMKIGTLIQLADSLGFKVILANVEAIEILEREAVNLRR